LGAGRHGASSTKSRPGSRRSRRAENGCFGAPAPNIYRLKREFRSLADVAHPNLVSLYELVVKARIVFSRWSWWTASTSSTTFVGRRPPPASRADRIRHVFRQLVEGIGVLHQKGKLHRDIKPSNILITRAGAS
jgi:serine/threonine protein kinase